jgi:hypothetical protein
MYKEGTGGTSEGVFIFHSDLKNMKGQEGDWFMCNPSTMELWSFPCPSDLSAPFDPSTLSLTEVPVYPPGVDVLGRVLAGDETVGETLASEFQFDVQPPANQQGPTADDLIQNASQNNDLPPEFLAQLKVIKEAEEKVAREQELADEISGNKDEGGEREPVDEVDIEKLEEAVKKATETFEKWDTLEKELEGNMKAPEPKK